MENNENKLSVDMRNEKPDHQTNDILEGPIVRTTLKLGIPILISQIVLFTYLMVDTFFISLIDKQSTALISGTGLVYTIYLITNNISSGLYMATSSVTSRGIGENNKGLIKRTGDTAILLALVIGIVCCAIGYIFAEDMIKHLAGSAMTADAIQYGLDYLRYLLPGMGLQLIMTSVGGILQGEGKSKEISIAVTASTILNIILAPLLIFSFGMGVKGAGLATSISIGLTVVLYLWFFIRKKTIMQIQWKIFAPNLKILVELLRMAIPACVGFLLITLSTIILNNVVGSLSEVSMNAWVLVSRTDQMFLIPAYAIGLATITMIGQNYGQGNMKRCMEIFRVNMVLCVIGSIFLAILYMIFAPVIFQQFSSIPDVIAVTVRQVRVLTFTTIGVAGIYITGFAFSATGRPMPKLICDVIRVAIVSFPILLPLLNISVKDMNFVFVFFGGGNLIAFFVSFIWVWNHLKKLQSKDNPQERIKLT